MNIYHISPGKFSHTAHVDSSLCPIIEGSLAQLGWLGYRQERQPITSMAGEFRDLQRELVLFLKIVCVCDIHRETGERERERERKGENGPTYATVCMWRSRDNLNVNPLFPHHLRHDLLLVHCCIQQASWPTASRSLSPPLISQSVGITETPPAPSFTGVPRIQTRVLMPVWQMLSPQNHVPTRCGSF